MTIAQARRWRRANMAFAFTSAPYRRDGYNGWIVTVDVHGETAEACGSDQKAARLATRRLQYKLAQRGAGPGEGK